MCLSPEKKFLFLKILTFLLSACFEIGNHTTKSAWSYSKTAMMKDEQFQISDSFLGTCDLVFLFSYSICMLLFGSIGDRINTRLLAFFTNFLSSITFMSIAFMRFSNFHFLPLFATLRGINGIFMALSWPAGLIIMTNWFGKEQRGVAFVSFFCAPCLFYCSENCWVFDQV